MSTGHIPWSISIDIVFILMWVLSILYLDALYLSINNIVDKCRVLCLDHNQITDISPLNACTNLDTLWIGDNPLTNGGLLIGRVRHLWYDIDDNISEEDVEWVINIYFNQYTYSTGLRSLEHFISTTLYQFNWYTSLVQLYINWIDILH